MDHYSISQMVSNAQDPLPTEASSCDLHQNIPKPDSFYGRSPDSLRKGKWTAEEEKYANKVIEHFNAGMLKLDEDERGITLRAYLSQKLGCDPMRITKKYTGASCLGKRVYHAYKQSGKMEDIAKAMRELSALEDDFRSKLNQSTRRRGNSGSSSGNYQEGNSITTPAIDALFKQPSLSYNWGSPHANHSSESSYTSYSMPAFSSEYISTMADHFNYGRPDHQQIAGLASGHSYGHLSTFPERDTSTMATTSLSSSGSGFFHRPATDNSPSKAQSQQMEEFQHNGLSILSQSAHESDALAFGRSISSGSNGGAGGGNSVTIYEHMPSRPTLGADAAGIVSEHPASVAAAVDAVTDFANPHKKVKITAHDTEAASSLLGFFNQLERNSSQEDMLHFFEGVQNHVIASTTSNTSTSTVRSPPKPSGNNSSSSTNPSSGGGGGGGTSTNGKNGTATYSPTNMATPAFAGGSAH